jgi:excisionase family DNA binding protein
MESNLIGANDKERTSLEIIDQALTNFAEASISNDTSNQARAKLVRPEGEEIELPDVVFRLLRQTVSYLAHGKAVKLISVGMELTTQAAADLLNVSRPHLVKLVDKGKIPCKKVGTHRRISFQDLMAYKAKQDAEQRRLLAEMAQFSQDLNLYEDFD